MIMMCVKKLILHMAVSGAVYNNRFPLSTGVLFSGVTEVKQAPRWAARRRRLKTGGGRIALAAVD
jgi:hypothetical protein